MRIKFFISNLQKHFELTVGALGFSNSVEKFLATIFVVLAELLRSTAGDNDVEQVDEMLSFSGFKLTKQNSTFVFYAQVLVIFFLCL